VLTSRTLHAGYDEASFHETSPPWISSINTNAKDLATPMNHEPEWPDTGVEGNGLLDLPQEMIIAILSRLSAKDLVHLGRSCKKLAEHAFVWFPSPAAAAAAAALS